MRLTDKEIKIISDVCEENDARFELEIDNKPTGNVIIFISISHKSIRNIISLEEIKHTRNLRSLVQLVIKRMHQALKA